MCTALNYLCNFSVSATFLPLVSANGLGVTYLGYGVLCGVGYFFVCARVVETKGRSLSDIEADLRQRSEADRVGS